MHTVMIVQVSVNNVSISIPGENTLSYEGKKIKIKTPKYLIWDGFH